MKKIIKQVTGNTAQITICDERWYIIGNKYIPSVTWIASCGYPKGIAYYKWLASKGWDEAGAIKVAAGDKGSKVHHAISLLIEGQEVKMDSLIFNPHTEREEELTLEEWECLMSFAAWAKESKAVFIWNEIIVINKDYNYAGTLDTLAEIGGELYIIDFKTSQNIWPEHELQLSAYKHAYFEPAKLALLQVGYRRNKTGYKFIEVEDKFSLFLAAKQIWANETEGVEPKKKDYPTSLKLELEAKHGDRNSITADRPAINGWDDKTRHPTCP